MERKFWMEVSRSEQDADGGTAWLVSADHPVTDKQEAYELVADWNGDWQNRCPAQPDIKGVGDIRGITVTDDHGRRLSKGSIAAYRANITREAWQAAR